MTTDARGIPINPEFPAARFGALPPDWTSYTSAAALALVLPRGFRQALPAPARATLVAGIDRYVGAYGEGDAQALVVRAERYLDDHLDDKHPYQLGDLRELLRLHAGLLLEGRGREALTSAGFLAAHVLARSGAAPAEGELWVLNEAMLDARPMSASYRTVAGASAESIFASLGADAVPAGGSRYVAVPIGARTALFQLSQPDNLAFANLVTHRYGPSPSWSLGSAPTRFTSAVETLVVRAYPALAQLRTRTPKEFARLPEIFGALYTSTAIAASDGQRLLAALDIKNLAVGVRVLEYVLGEARRSDLRARGVIYARLCDQLAGIMDDPASHLLATVANTVLGVGPGAKESATKYFMPPP